MLPELKQQSFKDENFDEIFIKDDFSSIKNKNIREFVLWLRTSIVSIGILMLATLLPVVCIFKASLKLLTLQPKEATKTLIGGLIATFAIMAAAVIGLVPKYLNRRICEALLPAVDTVLNSDQRKFFKPDNEQFEQGMVTEVSTAKGKIDALFYPAITGIPSIKYTILFSSNAETIVSSYENENKETRYRASNYQSVVMRLVGIERNIISFNYPGVSNTATFESSKDLVNAGIALVYRLTDDNKWSNEDISQNINFSGFSLGGAVAYQVALYFKQRYQIDIHVHAQNSFGSLRDIAAYHINEKLRVPLWCTRLFARMITYAAGGIEMDTLAALPKLNPLCVHFTNVKYDSNKEKKDHDIQKKSLFKKWIKDWRKQPGIDADSMMKKAALRKSIKDSIKYSRGTTAGLEKILENNETHVVKCGIDPKVKDKHGYFLGDLKKVEVKEFNSVELNFQRIMLTGEERSRASPRC